LWAELLVWLVVTSPIYGDADAELPDPCLHILREE